MDLTEVAKHIPNVLYIVMDSTHTNLVRTGGERQAG